MKAGILADDMGLGKTIECLGYNLHRSLSLSQRPGLYRPTLVLAPGMVCYQ